MSYARAYHGKIAGLGDYASDHAAWLQEKAGHDNAVAAYAAQSAGAAAGYASQLASYQRDLAAWKAEQAARAAAFVARTQQQLKNQRALDQANAAARAAGAVTPAGYPGCVSQAQHDNWQQTCSAMSQTVRGLGADPTGSACALALLPVCPPALPAIAPLRPQPTPPAQPVLGPPPGDLRPEPMPPASAPVPAITPGSPGPITTTPTKKSAGMLSNGLILVVVAVGGYALYRTFKKPKAAA
jgi:hypothetical protein